MQDFVYKTAQFLHFLYIYAKIRMFFAFAIILKIKEKMPQKAPFLGKNAVKMRENR